MSTEKEGVKCGRIPTIVVSDDDEASAVGMVA